MGTHTKVLGNRWHRLVLGGLTLILAVGAGLRSAGADEPKGKAATGRQWAVLIGVEKYTKANPLSFTVNDVRQLSETLQTRGDYLKENLLEITDKGATKETQPFKDSILNGLSSWLSKAGPEDTILIYFSGHGFQDKAGKMYLAPIDCDPQDPSATGIPIELVREKIAGCKAGLRVLVLDACHAGSEKGDSEPRELTTKDLQAVFENLEGVVTLASCKANEKSLIWEDKQQSLFSYWFNQGLKGHADQDTNGAVDIDELYKYVELRVRSTADTRFRRPQTPVRIVRTGVTGVPNIVKLQPQPLKTVLADMAEQLAITLGERQIKRVGVLEFIDESKLNNELLGGDFGLLGKLCSQELESSLIAQSEGGQFRVVDRKRLQQAMKDQHFQLKDLSSTVKLVSLSRSAGGLPVLATGSFKGRSGRIINLKCKLQSTESDDVIGEAGGTVALTEEQWAMLGRSTAVRPEDRRPELVQEGGNQKPTEDQVIPVLDKRADAGHPLLDPSFPFNVQLRVKGEIRKGAFRGNDYFVPVRKGEEYEVVIENKSGSLALMKLLVDGLDTLPKKGQTEEVSTTEKGIQMELWAQPVTNLSDARAWFLDPQDPNLKGGAPLWVIRGFTTRTGADGNMKKFLIVDAAESLAGRQGFTEQIGLITVAFYTPGGGARSTLGTAAGNDIKQDLTERQGPKAGNLIGVVHLRYVDAEALEQTAGK